MVYYLLYILYIGVVFQDLDPVITDLNALVLTKW